MTDEKLAIAVCRWLRLRDEASRLREERYGLLCDAEARSVFEVNHDSMKACWKNVYVSGGVSEPEYSLAPLDEWCPSCVERQKIHELYKRTAASRGAALRVLIRYYRMRREHPTASTEGR